MAAVSRFTCTRSDTSSEVNPAKKNPGRIYCMCCISYDVQWLEREESQYDMKLLSALFHIHDEALVEKNNKMMALSVINLQESLIKKCP